MRKFGSKASRFSLWRTSGAESRGGGGAAAIDSGRRSSSAGSRESRQSSSSILSGLKNFLSNSAIAETHEGEEAFLSEAKRRIRYKLRPCAGDKKALFAEWQAILQKLYEDEVDKEGKKHPKFRYIECHKESPAVRNDAEWRDITKRSSSREVRWKPDIETFNRFLGEKLFDKIYSEVSKSTTPDKLATPARSQKHTDNIQKILANEMGLLSEPGYEEKKNLLTPLWSDDEAERNQGVMRLLKIGVMYLESLPAGVITSDESFSDEIINEMIMYFGKPDFNETATCTKEQVQTQKKIFDDEVQRLRENFHFKVTEFLEHKRVAERIKTLWNDESNSVYHDEILRHVYNRRISDWRAGFFLGTNAPSEIQSLAFPVPKIIQLMMRLHKGMSEYDQKKNYSTYKLHFLKKQIDLLQQKKDATERIIKSMSFGDDALSAAREKLFQIAIKYEKTEVNAEGNIFEDGAIQECLFEIDVIQGKIFECISDLCIQMKAAQLQIEYLNEPKDFPMVKQALEALQKKLEAAVKTGRADDAATINEKYLELLERYLKLEPRYFEYEEAHEEVEALASKVATCQEKSDSREFRLRAQFETAKKRLDILFERHLEYQSKIKEANARLNQVESQFLHYCLHLEPSDYRIFIAAIKHVQELRVSKEHLESISGVKVLSNFDDCLDSILSSEQKELSEILELALLAVRIDLHYQMRALEDCLSTLPKETADPFLVEDIDSFPFRVKSLNALTLSSKAREANKGFIFAYIDVTTKLNRELEEKLRRIHKFRLEKEKLIEAQRMFNVIRMEHERHQEMKRSGSDIREELNIQIEACTHIDAAGFQNLQLHEKHRTLSIALENLNLQIFGIVDKYREVNCEAILDAIRASLDERVKCLENIILTMCSNEIDVSRIQAFKEILICKKTLLSLVWSDEHEDSPPCWNFAKEELEIQMRAKDAAIKALSCDMTAGCNEKIKECKVQLQAMRTVYLEFYNIDESELSEEDKKIFLEKEDESVLFFEKMDVFFEKTLATLEQQISKENDAVYFLEKLIEVIEVFFDLSLERGDVAHWMAEEDDPSARIELLDLFFPGLEEKHILYLLDALRECVNQMTQKKEALSAELSEKRKKAEALSWPSYEKACNELAVTLLEGELDTFDSSNTSSHVQITPAKKPSPSFKREKVRDAPILEALESIKGISMEDHKNYSAETQFYELQPYAVYYEVGDCLFEAVAAFIQNPAEGTGKKMREKAIAQLQQDSQLQEMISAGINSETEKLRLASGDEKKYASLDEYIDLMSADRTWGTHVELMALARSLQRPVVLVTPGNLYDQIIEEDYSIGKAPIFLYYAGANHYQPLAHCIKIDDPRTYPEQILQNMRRRIEERNAATAMQCPCVRH